MTQEKRTFRNTIIVCLVVILAGAILYLGAGRISKLLNKENAVTQNKDDAVKSKQDDMDMSNMDMNKMTASGTSERKILYYVDPMHPAYKSDKPGKAPDCGMDLVPVYEGEGGLGETMLAPGGVIISQAKQQLIGVTYGKVKVEHLIHTIRAVGKVTYDETKIVKISPKIEGWVEKVFADYTGQFVKKGEPLISIYSPELVSTQQEYLLAIKTKDALSKSPFNEVTSGGNSLVEASLKRLQLWDISDEEIKKIEQTGEPLKTLTMYSPESGFILVKNVFNRQRITPETELYEIADLSRIWVQAEVYEFEAPEIRLGQKATMRLPYSQGETFTGVVTYIYPQIDPATRTLKVRLEFPNPGLKLKPDMYANIDLQIDYGSQLSVPEEAVLDSGTEQIVFIAQERGRLEPRKVKLGAKVDNRYIIIDGLKPEETIVTSGNFLIDSESRLKSAAGGMADMPGMAGMEEGNEGKKSKESEKKEPSKGSGMADMPGM
ncbi:MAG: efflux RND transporter periplasmic adaptor subunit [Candidatus Schekmanbacteria bacterium]|nr:efflux RND transporter periplasmic adaptor subunit [Candidatus Schekmanbacteria bacterium]